MRDSKKYLGLGCACAICAAAVVGCTDDAVSSGTLVVSVESEETITQGISAGTGADDIADGWDVTFDKYLLTIGEIDLHFATDESRQAEAEELFVVDLAQVPAAGLPLWTLESLRSGRWEVNYHIGGAGHGAARHADVAQADFDRMVDADLTYVLEGTLAQNDGRSCPPPALASPGTDAVAAGDNAAGEACYANANVTFNLGVSAETFFGPCQIDGVSGVSIPSGGTQNLSLTIHGDHMFFNGFPTASEGGVTRLAQWLADCDLNVDGEVTQAELEAITLNDLTEVDSRYQLTGTGLADGSAWDYLVAQLKTQGHINGEGECDVDGEAHEHE